MKKMMSLVLGTVMAASLMACGGGSGSTTAAAPATTAAAAQTTAAAASESPAAGEKIWPTTKNVEIVCPATAGSGTDAICRALADHWGKQFPDTNFTVTNDASGGYTVAYEMGRNADPDGSRILVGTASMIFTYNFGIYDHLVTDPSEFKIIDNIRPDMDQGCVVVKADSPYQTLDDLVEAAKAAPNTLTIGTGSGNIVYGQAMAWEEALGVQFRKVDGSDNNERITNVLGGMNDMALLNESVAAQYVESGDMRILAVAQNERSKTFTETPCFAELGYPMKHFIKQNYILCSSPKMPEEMAQAISDSMAGLEDNEMFKQSFETVFKGASWDHVDRQTAISYVDELQQACVDLGITAE